MDKEDLNVIFSHKTDSWSTPEWFFKVLDKKYNFTLDPAADHHNHKCAKYYTMDDDGLKKDWKGETVFVNPPYSKIYDWVKKAATEVLINETIVVMLLPARTDTKWFHEFCLDGSVCNEITFIKGRLKFGDGKNSAPFPSMVVVFGKGFGTKPIINTMTNKAV
jgi:site-specific DNA-methyltransferase (adenine-specific)